MIARPRERFERLGADGLTEAELLAVFLRTGRRGMSAIQLGQELLNRFGTLEQLSKQTVSELASLPGMGRAKAVELKAAFALQERALHQKQETKPLDHPNEIYALMAGRLQPLTVEILFGLALDSRLHLIRDYQVSSGLLNQTLVHAREVFREAIAAAAAHLVLVHNHPSGDPHPSADDVRITRQMLRAGETLDIPLLDHVIIGRPSAKYPNGYVSLKQTGVMDFQAPNR
jgi:DNA repair protein RadC